MFSCQYIKQHIKVSRLHHLYFQFTGLLSQSLLFSLRSSCVCFTAHLEDVFNSFIKFSIYTCFPFVFLFLSQPNLSRSPSF